MESWEIMTERIKLTEDDIGIMDYSFDGKLLMVINRKPHDFKQLKQQILNDYEIVSRLTSNEKRDLALLKVCANQEQEIKQLKEELKEHKVCKDILNDYHNVVKSRNNLKQQLADTQDETMNLKQKLEKIEKECDKSPKAYILASFIKEILKD